MDRHFNVTPEEMPRRLTDNLTKIERETLMDILTNATNPGAVRQFGTIVVEDVVSTMAELEAQRQVELNEKRKELNQLKKEIEMLSSINHYKGNWKHS